MHGVEDSLSIGVRRPENVPVMDEEENEEVRVSLPPRDDSRTRKGVW